MAELVYAFDLKSNGETRAGSIPAPSTNNKLSRGEWYGKKDFCSNINFDDSGGVFGGGSAGEYGGRQCLD